ncbi:MAG: DUF4476 domain-containing protein [Kofleriaceae bacterium]|nr:DUF4476 domain-containing protein [Kofleriaceae bacterium]
MTRYLSYLVFTIVFVLSMPLAHADGDADRAAISDALAKLSTYADGLARNASRSEDRAVRKQFAPQATEIADELEALARRTQRDVSYAALGRDAVEIGRDASALVERADEAEDIAERKTLRAQAAALEQGVATTRKVIESLARESDRPAKPAKPTPMRQAAFDQLVQTIRAASFDDDKVEVVRHAAQGNWFGANQVATVMDLLSFDDGKIDAAVAMWPRITDPENSFVIFNKLAFDSSKDKLRKRVSK